MTTTGESRALHDVRNTLHEKKLAGTLRALAHRLPVKVYEHERHVWGDFDLNDFETGVELPEGWDIVRGGHDDLPALDRLGIGFAAAPQLLDAGHRWYLIRDHGRPIYSAWMFRGMVPSPAAPSGWIRMPDDIVNIEDSFLDPDYRGKGLTRFLMPTMRAQALADGVRRTITMMQADNAAVLAATARVGVREFATVDVRKFGITRTRTDWRNRRPDGPLFRSRIRVEQAHGGGVLPVSPVAAELTDALRAGLR